MLLDHIELVIGWLGGAYALLVLLLTLGNLFRALDRSWGRKTGNVFFLRRGSLVLLTIIYGGIIIILWFPVPLTLSVPLRIILLIAGSLVFTGGLTAYHWSRITLGRMFNASSGFGVQLFNDHRLVSSGPFAIVRHPMYVSIWIISLGGILLYRTWGMIFFGVTMLGLVRRAQREEQALEQEFGQKYKEYCQHVPAWFPLLRRSDKQ